MSKATTDVHFTIVDDELQVSAPLALAAVDDFFETEIGTSETMLALIEHHVRHDRTWQFTGNVCHLGLDHDTVTIEHHYTGARTTLTSADFRTLLAGLRSLLEQQN
ncbi:hypothetical protein [Actinocrispum sp. NPDC049592]|uniref:hypothetical protein n=1 Tax=Actinocrispum sp. NPDC049592 TaxID=3154835 RepID=UPI00342E7A20